MITMKQARKMCPADPPKAVYEMVEIGVDDEGIVEVPQIVQTRTLVEPFRGWARKRFRDQPRDNLSPKLRKIVHG